MNAEQARKLAKTNQRDLNYVLGLIKNNAEFGNVEFVFFEYITENVVHELMNLGYKVSRGRGHMGERTTIVNWE